MFLVFDLCVIEVLVDDLNMVGVILVLYMLKDDLVVLLVLVWFMGLLQEDMGDWMQYDFVSIVNVIFLVFEVLVKLMQKLGDLCSVVMDSKDFFGVDVLKVVLIGVGVEVCMFKVGVELIVGLCLDVVVFGVLL